VSQKTKRQLGTLKYIHMNTKQKSIGLIFVGGLLSAILMILFAYFVEPNINAVYGNKYAFILRVIEWTLVVSTIPASLFLIFLGNQQIRSLYLLLMGFVAVLVFIASVFITDAIEKEVQGYVENPIFEKCIFMVSDVRKCIFKSPAEFFVGT
jgi:hypothetical protein